MQLLAPRRPPPADLEAPPQATPKAAAATEANQTLADTVEASWQDGQGLRGLMPSPSKDAIEAFAAQVNDEDAPKRGPGSGGGGTTDGASAPANPAGGAVVLADGAAPPPAAKKRRSKATANVSNEVVAPGEGLDGPVVTPKPKKTRAEAMSHQKTVAKTLRENLKTQTAAVKEKSAELKKLQKKFDHWRSRHPTNILSMQFNEKEKTLSEDELKNISTAWAAMNHGTGCVLQTTRA